MITQEMLKEVVHYDPLTGVFSWRVRRSGVRFDQPAGWLHDGYVLIGVFGGRYRAHRLAWLWMNGKWPDNDVDHRNGIRDDNRWTNLRDAGREINGQNLRAAKSHNVSTGVLGVHRRGNRFSAKVVVGKDQHYLGLFDTPEAAHAAYVTEKRRLHPGCTI